MDKPYVPDSVIVNALADMASQGRYDGVTREQANNMTLLYEAVADLINRLEEEEKNQLEQEKQDAAANEESNDD